jgi:hypothetical protein
VPGKVPLSGEGLNWRNAGLRTRQYWGQDVIVPALSCFVQVSRWTGMLRCRGALTGRGARRPSGHIVVRKGLLRADLIGDGLDRLSFCPNAGGAHSPSGEDDLLPGPEGCMETGP